MTSSGAADPAVFDTSFWIHAYGSRLLAYVRRRYVLGYTAAVAAELPERFASGREFRRLVQAGDLTQVDEEPDRFRRFSAGERSALNVALAHADWTLLLDDRRPYEEAERRGLRVVCSPLLVAALYREREIDASEGVRLLVALAGLGSISPRLVRLGVEALALARQARQES